MTSKTQVPMLTPSIDIIRNSRGTDSPITSNNMTEITVDIITNSVPRTPPVVTICVCLPLVACDRTSVHSGMTQKLLKILSLRTLTSIS